MIVNLPAVSVNAFFVPPVPLAVTLTPGRESPSVSLTSPVSVPPVSWAINGIP